MGISYPQTVILLYPKGASREHTLREGAKRPKSLSKGKKFKMHENVSLFYWVLLNSIRDAYPKGYGSQSLRLA
jgi:hypothetical protein